VQCRFAVVFGPADFSDMHDASVGARCRWTTPPTSRSTLPASSVARSRRNRRCLDHLSALDDFSAGLRALGRLTTKPHAVDGQTVRGINFFASANAWLQAVQRPKVNIAGIRRADLLPLLGSVAPHWLSQRHRRLRDSGEIKRLTGTYRYIPGASRSHCGRRPDHRRIIAVTIW